MATIAPVAPVAASAPAPAAAPVSAPVSAPTPVVPAAATPTAPLIDKGGVTSNVDPSKYPVKEDYAAALLAEKMAAIPTVEDAPVEEQATVTELPTTEPEVAAPDAVTEPEVSGEVAEEVPEFDFDPPTVVTPEVLSKMVTDNPEFGKLLEADPKLKGQLYKTAREAAEVQPYKEIFPDLQMAKDAAEQSATFSGMKDVFMGSTTKEGARTALAKIMELSYERGEDGQVLMQNGQPVVGQDFYGFVDNVVAMDIEHRAEEAAARIQANQYHLTARTQQEADDAFARDKRAVDYAADISGDAIEATDELPEPLRKQKEALDAREKALAEKEQGGKVQSRQEFESSMQTAARDRINSEISKIIASAKKQGAAMSPFLEETLPQIIGSKLIAKLGSIEGIKKETAELQKLAVGDSAKTRRLAAIDRHIQSYLPSIALEALKAAGAQPNSAKIAKVAQQAANTAKTEFPKTGSAGAPTPLSSSAAFDQAQAEWTKANPGKPFEKTAREQILPRVLQLMTVR